MFYIYTYLIIGLLLGILVGFLAKTKRFDDTILTSPFSLILILIFWPIGLLVFIYGATSGYKEGKKRRKKYNQELNKFDPLLEVMQQALKERKGK